MQVTKPACRYSTTGHGCRRHGWGNMLQATSYKLQATSYKLQAAFCMPHATGSIWHATNYMLHAMNAICYKLHATSCMLHAMCHLLQATCYMLHATKPLSQKQAYAHHMHQIHSVVNINSRHKGEQQRVIQTNSGLIPCLHASSM